jgi:putative membrane-bound dehydrogenase-like protein
MLRLSCLVVTSALVAVAVHSAEPEPFTQPAISVQDGYAVELAAGPPLVKHPIMAGFDDRGRLYVAETAGINMQRPELLEKLPNFVTRLEDTDGDGRFDKRTTFADKLTFPQGALWHDGWLYVASSGAIWRFADKDDDGVAEIREMIVSSFGFTGNAADVHGCFLGAEGRIWWCEGRHGHDIVDAAGQSISKGKAARIFSSRPDGSDVRVHCGGGMDNPVEIDWTDEGEMLGTVNIFYHKRGDCLVHWMHGGVYPRHDQPEITGEFRKTGDLLDAVHDYGHVAVSGTCRLRGAGFQPATTFLVTEFNTHKVKRTTLTRDGATFRAETTDFLQAASDDFHPTDVLEDADGSFLVIDTGGWFRIGCPTSQIAKPNILGAIYRVRRTDTPGPKDPRGLAIEWDKLDGPALVALLGDPRFAVRERAIATLALQGDASVPYLSRALVSKDAATRRNAIWTLTRIGTPKAQGSVRLVGLADKDPSVLAAAAYSAGATRGADAVGDLCELLTASDTTPPVARQAATALGQIGDAAAVPTILQRLHSDSDRVLEHALIYALIEIADRKATAPALADDSPRVRRAALIALDQMPGGELSRDEVAALLDTTDQPLLTAALDVISRRPGWADELVAIAAKLLERQELSESDQSLVSGSLVAMSSNENVQALIADSLADQRLLPAKQALLLDVIERSGLDPLPAKWAAALHVVLRRQPRNPPVLVQAINLAGAHWLDEYERPLQSIIEDRRPQPACQIAALGALAPRMEKLSPGEFEILRSPFRSDEGADLRLPAARVLSIAPLSDVQLAALTNEVATAGPLEIKMLVAAYERTTNVELRQLLVKTLTMAQSRVSLTEGDVQFLLQRPSGGYRDALASALGLKKRPDRQTDELKLATLSGDLPSGGVDSGKLVFHGRKAACGTCHRVGSEGGKIGPDLSKVGERRNERDLLEAVIVPSASIARGYESQTMRTTDGRTLTGLVVRETTESVFLRTSDQREIRLRRSDIEEQKRSDLSIMPAGLENTMTRQELADLLAYLRSLK